MSQGAKIPEDVQKAIKERWLAGETIVSIAKALGVCRNTCMRYASSNYSVAKRESVTSGNTFQL